jgi:translation initiation factor 1A
LKYKLAEEELIWLITEGDVPEEVTRVRTPRKDKNEVLATVSGLLGSKRVTLQCMDGVVRMGRIPGSKSKKMWVREGDIVIANPWEIQDSKADVTWKYTRPQVEWLERKGYLR